MGHSQKNLLYRRLLDNTGRYLNKIDEYNEERIWKASTKLKYAAETAGALGLDVTVVSGIIFGDELRRTAYGSIGERFLQEKYPGYDELDFAKRILTGILEGTDPETVNVILAGVDRLRDREDTTAEQKLAFMLIDAQNFAQKLDTEPKRSIAFINYKNQLICMSAEKKRLTGPELPVLKDPRPEKRKVDETRAVAALERVFRMFKDHELRIPDSFEGAFAGLEEAAAIACYIVCHPEKEIEKESGLGVFSKEST